MYRQFQQVTWPIKYANPLNKQHQSKTSLTVKLSRQHFYRGYKIWQRNRISMPKCKHYVLSPVTSTTLKDYTGSKVTNYKHYFSFTTLLSMSHLVTMKNPPEKTHQTVLKDIRLSVITISINSCMCILFTAFKIMPSAYCNMPSKLHVWHILI